MTDFLLSWSVWPIELVLILLLFLYLWNQSKLRTSTPTITDENNLVTVRLEPARITVAAASGLLVAIGFVFTVIADNAQALEVLSETFLWLWVYAALTLLVAIYQAYSVYGALYNGNPQPAWLDNAITTTIYIFFLSTLLRGTLVFYVFSGLPVGTGTTGPLPPGSCCTDLTNRIASLERRVDDLENKQPMAGDLSKLLERIVFAIEQIEKKTQSGATDLGPIGTQLENIHKSLGDMNLPDAKSISDRLKDINASLKEIELGGVDKQPVVIQPDGPEIGSVMEKLGETERVLASLMEQSKLNLSDEDWPSGEQRIVNIAREEISFLVVLTEAMRLARSMSDLLASLADTAGDTKAKLQNLVSELLKKLTDITGDLLKSYLEAKLNDIKDPDRQKPVWAATEDGRIVVNFGFNSTYISAADANRIAEFGDKAGARPECVVVARGYSDVSGGEAANMLLAFKRISETLNLAGPLLRDRTIISPLGETRMSTAAGTQRYTGNSGKDWERRVELTLLCPQPIEN